MTTPLLQTASIEDTTLGTLPRASLALLFHTADDGLALVTAHEVIHDKNGAAHIGPGRAALPSDERKLSDLLARRKRRGAVEVLPANVLYAQDGALAWWIPSERRPMLVRDDAGKDHAVDVLWPALVALVVNRKLHIAALATTERPAADTALYHAPLANTYNDTSVCTGSARLPARQSIADIATWTEVITRTWFTHDNHAYVLPKRKGKKRAGSGGNYRAADFWINRAPDAPAPAAADMVPLQVTLAEWIESASAEDTTP